MVRRLLSSVLCTAMLCTTAFGMFGKKPPMKLPIRIESAAMDISPAPQQTATITTTTTTSKTSFTKAKPVTPPHQPPVTIRPKPLKKENNDTITCTKPSEHKQSADQLVEQISDLFQHIEKNHKTFKPGQYSRSLRKAKDLILTLNSNDPRQSKWMSTLKKAMVEYKTRKKNKKAPNANAGKPEHKEPVSPTPLQKQVDQLNKEVTQKDIANEQQQANFEKQNQLKVIVKDVALIMFHQLSPGVPAIAAASAIADFSGIGHIKFESEEVRRQINNDEAYRDVQRIIRNLEAEQEEAIHNLHKPTANQDVRIHLYQTVPEKAILIDCPCNIYHKLHRAQFEEEAFSSGIIANYDQALQTALITIDYCCNGLPLNEIQRKQLLELNQFFNDQRNFLQSVLDRRYAALSQFATEISEKNIPDLQTLDHSLLIELEIRNKNIENCDSMFKYIKNNLIEIEKVLASYDHFNRWGLRYINALYDMIKTGDTEENCRRMLAECMNKIDALTKQGSTLEVQIAQLNAQHELIKKTIVNHLARLRAEFEQPSSPCQQKLFVALDEQVNNPEQRYVLVRTIPADVAEAILRDGGNPALFSQGKLNPLEQKINEQCYENIVHVIDLEKTEGASPLFLDTVLTTTKASIEAVDQASQGNYKQAIVLTDTATNISNLCCAIKRSGIYGMSFAKGAICKNLWAKTTDYFIGKSVEATRRSLDAKYQIRGTCLDTLSYHFAAAVAKDITPFINEIFTNNKPVYVQMACKFGEIWDRIRSMSGPDWAECAGATIGTIFPGYVNKLMTAAAEKTGALPVLRWGAKLVKLDLVNKRVLRLIADHFPEEAADLIFVTPEGIEYKVGDLFSKEAFNIPNIIENAAKDGEAIVKKYGLKASELKMTKTVLNHASDVVKKGINKGALSRPYIGANGVNFLIDDIMAATEPTIDKILKNGLRWDTPGHFINEGIWELSVDLDTKIIVHLLFKSLKG